MWDGSDTTVCSAFICLCLSLSHYLFLWRSFAGRAPSFEDTAGEDPKQMMRAILYSHTLMNRCTWLSAITHMFVQSIYLWEHIHTHSHTVYLLILFSNCVPLIHTHISQCYHGSCKNTVGIQLILTKRLYNYCGAKSCILSKPFCVSLQPGFAAFQQLLTLTVPPTRHHWTHKGHL